MSESADPSTLPTAREVIPMPPGQPYTCQDYRKEMVLLGLRNRLNTSELTEEERLKILTEIRRLEEEMGMT